MMGPDASFVRNLEDASYRFALTMPAIPHSYTLRKEWCGEKPYTEAVRYMRAYEVDREWRGRKYQSLLLNGYQYWTMGAPAEETVLINRDWQKYGPTVATYDQNAYRYDELWSDRASEQERKDFFSRVRCEGRVLDIGCGTGALVDYRYKALAGCEYVGIDPSAGMLAAFAMKHTGYRNKLVRTSFAHYWPRHKEGFDTIVAMFGAASYLRSDDLPKIRHLLRPGGNAYLMYCATPSRFHKSIAEDFTDAETPAEAQQQGRYKILQLEA